MKIMWLYFNNEKNLPLLFQTRYAKIDLYQMNFRDTVRAIFETNKRFIIYNNSQLFTTIQHRRSCFYYIANYCTFLFISM